MAARRSGAVNQERLEPADAHVKRHRRQSARAAGDDRQSKHPLPLVGKPPGEPLRQTGVKTSKSFRKNQYRLGPHRGHTAFTL